ncbi:MAG TPA: DNA-formamidopyrimidine glycosylase family protein [Solirubrobacteraceae bacterium]|nr:DNA-formamidopyrimidine glycosylase family protein [Solirubrobacteraceae bacterium]
MPEGDTIHHAANRIRPLLEGRVPDAIETPHPRFARDRWPERLGGRAVTALDACGKHLLISFEGDLVVHSHLRMTGYWGTYRDGQRWSRSPRRAWLVLRAGAGEAVQFDGPVLELLTSARVRNDPRIAHLGPDILAPELDEPRFLRRLRQDDPARPIGDALLEQRTIAGIGNIWKSEGCFAAAVDPWRATAAVADEEALAIVRAARAGMLVSAQDGFQARLLQVYDRAGRPCPRCGAPLQARRQGEGNRSTYWCPACQT